MRKFETMEERLDFIEFRQRLLFDNDSVSRLLFEYEITDGEYTKIMNLMDEYRSMIDNNKKVYSGTFEDEIYQIVPSHNGDYHFCEYICKSFMEEGRWEEVFPALYGDNPKYSYLRG